MIGAQYGITREQYLERERLKRFYNNPIGYRELEEIIRMGGLLDKIDVGDEKTVLAHNFAVEKLERLGLLDEEGLQGLIKWLLNREPTKLPAEDKGESNAYRMDGKTH